MPVSIRCVLPHAASFDVVIDTSETVAALKKHIAATDSTLQNCTLILPLTGDTISDYSEISHVLEDDLTVLVLPPMTPPTTLPLPTSDLLLHPMSRPELNSYASTVQSACGTVSAEPDANSRAARSEEAQRRAALSALFGAPPPQRDSNMSLARELFAGVADDAVEPHLISAAGINEEMVSNLTAMGFEAPAARRALLLARRDVNGAVEKLLDPAVNLSRPMTREMAVSIAASMQLGPPGSAPPPRRPGPQSDVMATLLRLGLG